jgi:Flp pilus assembly pilin Flp
VAFIAVALLVGNAKSVATWLRSKWDAVTELPPTTTVSRMLDEVERGRR